MGICWLKQFIETVLASKPSISEAKPVPSHFSTNLEPYKGGYNDSCKGLNHCHAPPSVDDIAIA